MVVLSWPAILALELTSACSSHCLGCSNVFTRQRSSSSLPASRWIEIIAACASHTAQFRLTGGEPTLHSEFFEILDAATSHDAWVTIFTNGRWTKPEAFIRQAAGRKKLAGLLISLHGARPASHEAFTRVRGSFAETIANARCAIDQGVPVAFSTIITHRNLPELEAIVELGQQLGVQQVVFNRYIGRPLPGVEPSRVESQVAVRRIEAMILAGNVVKYGICVPQCFELNASEGCLAGTAYAAIDPWGNLRPCTHSPTVLGSLNEFTLPELWHSPAMDAWRALMPLECFTCHAYSTCHGGCRAVQELRSDRRDPFRRESLKNYVREPSPTVLPSSGRPIVVARLQEEAFGYSLLGRGQVVPLHPGARPIIEACNGQDTFHELAARFGQSGLDFLGELWAVGMIEIC